MCTNKIEHPTTNTFMYPRCERARLSGSTLPLDSGCVRQATAKCGREQQEGGRVATGRQQESGRKEAGKRQEATSRRQEGNRGAATGGQKGSNRGAIGWRQGAGEDRTNITSSPTSSWRRVYYIIVSFSLIRKIIARLQLSGHAHVHSRSPRVLGIWDCQTMQMTGPSNCDLHHCFANPWGRLLRRDVKIWHEQSTFLLLSNCLFEVFVAFHVKLLFTTKSCLFFERS